MRPRGELLAYMRLPVFHADASVVPAHVRWRAGEVAPEACSRAGRWTVVSDPAAAVLSDGGALVVDLAYWWQRVAEV